MARFSLKARYVFPVERLPDAGGIVTIDQGRIVDVGTGDPGGPVRDLGNVALIPGLVNAHTHLEFSLLDQPLGAAGTSLPDWIRLVLAWRDSATADRAGRQAAIDRGIAESIRHGTTTVGEIVSHDGSLYHSAAGRIGLTLFSEVIAAHRRHVADAVRRVSGDLDREAGAADGGIGVSPHAPYTVCLEAVEALAEVARRRRLPLAMHLAESQEELRLLATGDGPLKELLVERSAWDPDATPRGTRPLEYLKRLADVRRVLIVHGNYLDPEELAYLASHRQSMLLVYCPRTHAFFRHEPYPLAGALALGVRVALGTDGRGSNPDLSLWEELRFVARQHGQVAPSDILEMGTLQAAKALQRDSVAGSLVPGKRADLAAIRLPDALSPRPVEDLILGGGPVADTWYCGQPATPPAGGTA